MKKLLFVFKLILLTCGVFGLLLIATNLLDFKRSDKVVEEAFAQTPFSPKAHFIDFPEGKLHYITVGDPQRTPLLLIHGSPGAWTDFLQLITRTDLLDNFYVITVDRPAYGATTLPAGLSLRHQAARIDTLVEKFFSDKDGILLGHSYGAALAVQLAKRNAKKLQGLVSVAGAVANPYQDRRWYNHVVKKTFVKWLISDYLVASNREMWQLEKDLQRMEKGLDEFSKPVAIIQGENDWLVDYRSGTYLQGLLPKADVQIFTKENMNHFVIWTNEQLIVEALLWVKSH